MADLVFAFGSSHGPTIATTPSEWERIAQRDMKDPRYNFAELIKNAPSAMAEEITMERKQQRYDACQVGIAKLAGKVQQAHADVAIVVSNPHGMMPDDVLPVFGVFRGEVLSQKKAEQPRERRDAGRSGPPPVVTSRPARPAHDYPAYPPLADYLIDELIEEGFDVAGATELRPEIGLDEAFQVFYELYDPEVTIPMVPLIVSRYLPNQATPARCVALGRALRRVIDSWASERNVVLMASGGLSHQILDEKLDRQVVEALTQKDFKTLASLDRTRLNGAPGTPEILNWIIVAAAMDPTPMTLVDYVPCYRSLAGTGHGITLGYWD
jgi:3-O-methylgallate 3,4-dioxygenase